MEDAHLAMAGTVAGADADSRDAAGCGEGGGHAVARAFDDHGEGPGAGHCLQVGHEGFGFGIGLAFHLVAAFFLDFLGQQTDVRLHGNAWCSDYAAELPSPDRLLCLFLPLLSVLLEDPAISFRYMWNEFVKQFITNKGYVSVLEGLVITAEIAIFGLLIGIVIGTLIGIVRVMPKYKLLPRILDKICVCYLELFRGTPIVVQLLIGYWVLLPTLNISVDSGVPVAIIVFGLNSGAYVSEIMRAGIQSVDAGQLEAGRAVGLPYSVAMMKIVIPQAIKNILPTLGNEFIALVKDTSVVSFVAAVDLYKTFTEIGNRRYEYLMPYLAMAIMYIVLVMLISFGVKMLERRLKRNERAATK